MFVKKGGDFLPKVSLKELDKKINPTEKILVMPADIGQAAKTQAKEFKEAVNVSGIINPLLRHGKMIIFFLYMKDLLKISGSLYVLTDLMRYRIQVKAHPILYFFFHK